MNVKQRVLRTTAAIAIGVAALLTIAACQSAGGQAVAASAEATAAAQISDGVAASGSASQSASAAGGTASASASTSESASGVSASATTTSKATKTNSGRGSGSDDGSGSDSGSGSGSDTGGGSGSGSGGGSHTKNAPSSPDPRFVSASAGCVLSDDDGEYHLIVSWELADATGMALSVDNPGLVGSYGTYSWHGSQDLSELGCYAGDRTQDIELYSVGGNGNRAKKRFHVHENHNRITPPPFAGNTNVPSTATSPSTTTNPPTTTTAPKTTTTAQSQ